MNILGSEVIRTCVICTEPTKALNIFKNGTVCAHPFCKGCVAKYIHVKVLDHGAAAVNCPAAGCGKPLNALWCRPILDPQLFLRWSDLLCRSAVEGSDACYCPNSHCSELILNDCGGPAKGASRCPNCKEPFCFQCRIAWRCGHRCRKSTHDVLFELLAAVRKWARCPACYHYVERIDGCFLITCRCGTSFCYDCGRKARSHNHKCVWGNLTEWFFRIVKCGYH